MSASTLLDERFDNQPLYKRFAHHSADVSIPNYITDNLKFSLFNWQQQALKNLIIFNALKVQKKDLTPTHLMFNMATGSGKTLVMASLILYYYQQGYRHFIFFVNQNNIVHKTENNFIHSTHHKYLFTDKIVIDNHSISIDQVDTFSPNPRGIEIKFTSIQQLYNDIHTQRENQTTLRDLQALDIVMLADEAHHLNAMTKAKSRVNSKAKIESKDNNKRSTLIEMDGRTSQQDIERRGWEHTVIELILNKNAQLGDNRNVLLEFSATLPDNPDVITKYADKLIIKFDLKTFLRQGYTKEINLISTSLETYQRVLLALLFALLRHQIALKYDIANFKPVVLFRSQTIVQSRQDYDQFLLWVNDIDAQDLRFIDKLNYQYQPQQPVQNRIQQLISFIQQNDISYAQIADWIKQSYQPRSVIITNSQSNTTKTEKTDDKTERLLNSLENTHNPIRAIFTVDRLTEGWDVLNLYDIVKLYQNQNATSKKLSEATTKEKQLIGRGVRYYPFSYQDTLTHKRKFDDDPAHDLRLLEELFYHDEQSLYITHLKDELRKEGYIHDNPVFRHTSRGQDSTTVNKLNSTKESSIERTGIEKTRMETLDNLRLNHRYIVPSKLVNTEVLTADHNSEQPSPSSTQTRVETRMLRQMASSEQEAHIIKKALNIKAQHPRSIYRFDQLQKALAVNSINELIDPHLAHLQLSFIIDSSLSYDDIAPQHKLNALLEMLDIVQAHLSANQSSQAL